MQGRSLQTQESFSGVTVRVEERVIMRQERRKWSAAVVTHEWRSGVDDDDDRESASHTIHPETGWREWQEPRVPVCLAWFSLVLLIRSVTGTREGEERVQGKVDQEEQDAWLQAASAIRMREREGV